jgi:hypothetical protein
MESRAAVAREGVTFLAALVVAEFLYKFHSFTLECLAFLVTWAALSGLVDLGTRVLGRGGRRREEP